MPKQTINQVLLGDTLATLAERVSDGDSVPDKIIIIGVGHALVKVAYTTNMTFPEIIGALNMAADRVVSLYGGGD